MSVCPPAQSAKIAYFTLSDPRVENSFPHEAAKQPSSARGHKAIAYSRVIVVEQFPLLNPSQPTFHDPNGLPFLNAGCTRREQKCVAFEKVPFDRRRSEQLFFHREVKRTKVKPGHRTFFLTGWTVEPRTCSELDFAPLARASHPVAHRFRVHTILPYCAYALLAG